LSDVDWIGETEEVIYLIEFKNPSFAHSDNNCKCKGCDCIPCKDESSLCVKCGKSVVKKAIKRDNYFEFLEKSCKKYYGGTFYLLAIGKNKPIKYYCVVNHALADRTWRDRATAAVKKRLPFVLQETESVSIRLIEDFKVVSIEEWNELHPVFPLKQVI